MALIDIQAVRKKATMSRSTIYQQIKEGKFPAPVRIGDRAVRWLEEEVDAWLQGRIQARSDAK